MNTMYLWHIHHTFRTTHLLSDVGEAVDKLDVAVKQKKIVIVVIVIHKLKCKKYIYVNKQLH